ncbi:hypothetical protein JL101_031530 (plasmid) [Skermanella rosea]|uniref:hypothetical protein n=1 Tax=Skermanella rosea TaxID=1817965 RepID=UPI001931D856|nr:hypothetical protein [Skermanella rosea]UEM07468.1 hypothetical protein JL101_031530 [Skermanella rosea]
MLLPCRVTVPTAAPPCPVSGRRERPTRDVLEVVFSTTGDLIRIHSYGTDCSAAWDAALTSGRLHSRRDDGTFVAIRPDEWTWLQGIRPLASEWLAAVEAAEREWTARAAIRIQRYDDRSNGLIDLVVRSPGRR